MLSEIHNFLQLTDDLLTSGMPTASQVAEIAQAGVKLVINLAPFDPETDLRDEPEMVKSAGMDYLNIPVDWDAPRQSDLESFLRAMDANRDRKILVHCRANYRATGFVAVYRVRRLGWQPRKALADVERIWHPEDYPVWQEFLDANLDNRETK